MKKSMPFLIVTICLLTLTGLRGQDLIVFEPMETRSDESAFRSHFRKYALGSIDVDAVSNLLRSNQYFDSLTIVADGTPYSFSLAAKDVRGDEYALRVITDHGIETQSRSENKTYSGLTWDDANPVCITADEKFFMAMIMTSNGPVYIESARLIDPAMPADAFVIFNETDLIKRVEGAICGAKASVDHEGHGSHGEDTTAGRSMMPCIITDYAIANDYLMFQKYGSATRVEVQNLAVLNLVNTNYDTEFAMEVWHRAQEIVVAASAASDPWYTGTGYNALLNSFTAWAPSGFVSNHDAGSLWTNRTLDAGVVGLAWVGTVCTDSAYNILVDFTTNFGLLRVLQSHELGHNYGYTHDAGPDFIMSPYVSESTVWSAASISTINNALFNEGYCLSFCPPVSQGRVGIGTTSPHFSAILDISSTNKGLLIPRMTSIDRNKIYKPADGLMIYDTNTKSLWFFNNSTWIEMHDRKSIPLSNSNEMTLGLPGNLGLGVPDAMHKLDIALQPRITEYSNSHPPAGLPVYITGTLSDCVMEMRTLDGQQGIGFNKSGIYSAGYGYTGNMTLAAKGNGYVAFNAGFAERMRILSTGQVGIGNAAPAASAILDVSSTTKGMLVPRMTTAERNAIAAPVNGLLVFDITTNSFWYRVTSTWIELADNLDQEVYRNGPDKIYMALTDSVGIGTNNPATKLEVRTPINRYGISHTDGTVNLSTWIGVGGELGTRSNHSLFLYANDGVNQFQLTPTGNVGIGVASPDNRLSVSNKFGVDANGAIHFKNTPRGIYAMQDGASSRMLISHSTTFPTWGMQYVGASNEIRFLGDSVMAMSVYLGGGGLVQLNKMGIGTNNVTGLMQFKNDAMNRKVVLFETASNEFQFAGFGTTTSTLRYQVAATTHDHVFYAGASAASNNELLRIKGGGNVTIAGVVEVENMIAAPFQNGFSSFNAGFAPAGYHKDKMGRVHLRGLVNTPAAPNGVLMFTLPVGYRPTTGAVVFMTLSNNALARVDIQANGNVLVNFGAGSSWISLDGLSFKAE